MLSGRRVHNAEHQDVSNGFRDRRACHGGKLFELRIPRSRNSNFYPMLLGVLKDQEEEAQKLVSSLYCSVLTTEQVGKIYEQFYGKHSESATNWKDVFEDLKERGVAVVDLLVCDGLSGIENTLADTFPKADLQLCTVHLKRNILPSKDIIMTGTGFILPTSNMKGKSGG